MLELINTSSVYMGKYPQTRRKFAIHVVPEELQYIWQFHPAMRKMDQKLMSNPKGMTKTVETNQDLSSVHGQVPATKDRGTNPSCPLRNCNIAVCFVKQYHMVCKTDQNTSLTPNERTHPAQTNQDLFLVHAEWLANKDGASNPSRS